MEVEYGRRSGKSKESGPAMLMPVVQNEFNGGGQAFQALLAGLSLAVGFRHLGAEGDEPLAISLNDGSAAVSHVHKLPAGGPAASLKSRGPNLRLCTFFAFCFLLSAFCLRAWGQYSIDWSKVAGGGGASTGGVYAVSGTIGQPDAGTMIGGNYSLTGGFWSLIAVVQTPGAPYLWVMRTPTNTVCVWWALPADGWVLEWTNRVVSVSAPWPQVSPPYQTNTTQAWIIEPATTGSRFYRLHKPSAPPPTSSTTFRPSCYT